MDNKFKGKLPENVLKKFLASLSQHENWLAEQGNNAQLSHFTQKIQELDNSFQSASAQEIMEIEGPVGPVPKSDMSPGKRFP